MDKRLPKFLIRKAVDDDGAAIEKLHLDAFPANEGESVARLALELLDQGENVLSLVAEANDQVVGHIAFSPVLAPDHENWKGSILAPLGIRPGFQKGGIGTGLVRQGIEMVSDSGIDLVFVYGDPEYYGRFGFEAGVASPYVPAYELAFPFGWQAINVSGRQARGQIKLKCVDPLNHSQLW